MAILANIQIGGLSAKDVYLRIGDVRVFRTVSGGWRASYEVAAAEDVPTRAADRTLALRWMELPEIILERQAWSAERDAALVAEEEALKQQWVETPEPKPAFADWSADKRTVADQVFLSDPARAEKLKTWIENERSNRLDRIYHPLALGAEIDLEGPDDVLGQCYVHLSNNGTLSSIRSD